MRHLVAIFFAVALLAQHAPAPPAGESAAAPLGPPPKFFIQASDPQFGMYTKDADFAQETANFEFFIASVNRLKPEFVVITGDLTNKPGDADQIAEFHRIAKKLDSSIKLYNVAGNHDVQNEPTPESLARYRKNWGPDYYTFDSGDIRGIVLDSSLIQAPINVQSEADKQEKWLRAELAKAKADGRRVIVFQHIPFFLVTADEPDQYFNIPKQHRARYLALFHEYGVQYIFAGHYHRNAEGHDGNLDMVVTCAVGMPIAPDSSGFRIVRLDSMRHPYIGLGNIPNQVTAALK